MTAMRHLDRKVSTNSDPVDRDPEPREAITARLARAPVVLLRQYLPTSCAYASGRSLRPVIDEAALGPSGFAQAAFEVLEVSVARRYEKERFRYSSALGPTRIA
jgi:hypothetical protein